MNTRLKKTLIFQSAYSKHAKSEVRLKQLIRVVRSQSNLRCQIKKKQPLCAFITPGCYATMIQLIQVFIIWEQENVK
jgi:hypothetical protein